MKKSARNLILLLAAVIAVPSALYAQDPYDDLYTDIVTASVEAYIDCINKFKK